MGFSTKHYGLIVQNKTPSKRLKMALERKLAILTASATAEHLQQNAQKRRWHAPGWAKDIGRVHLVRIA